ncbi:hypothetical protein [Cupriavidus pauculus]|jgi:hypothetical protein|nr:hypothetical protein [Cupriavidus pauculus]MBY4729060.1 hypothetical protein [Cupriavidus pauculus]MCM3605218.1 hypothetical protein [Cupriavidus pauculus]UAK99672.1 hypothetical protein K8O84_17165 [Cupriavidus pauculus]
MLHNDVQDRNQKMQQLRGTRRYTWTHPIFLIGIALIVVGFVATLW